MNHANQDGTLDLFSVSADDLKLAFNEKEIDLLAPKSSKDIIHALMQVFIKIHDKNPGYHHLVEILATTAYYLPGIVTALFRHGNYFVIWRFLFGLPTKTRQSVNYKFNDFDSENVVFTLTFYT